jgi:hypothetical protein
MNTPQSPIKTIIPVATGLILLGIGLYTGTHGATAIGLILAVLFGSETAPRPGPELLPIARSRDPRFIASSHAFSVAELFEVSGGFGIMRNTYDPLDLAANATASERHCFLTVF